jgi:hypothetical protein
MSISQNFPNIAPSLSLDFANTKKLDPRITFARASTARVYDGKTVAKAEENLFQFSQEFDNAYWTKNATTVTANSIAAPDGTTTADTLVAAGTGLNAILRSIAHTSGLITFSIYAKAGTKSVLQISSAALGSGAGRANFDLSTGTLGTVDAAWTASIVDAGNGWYRCIATFTGNGVTGNFVLSMQDSTTAAREASSTAGDLYLWGAQWEVRNFVTAYTPTTTQPITNYIPVLQTAANNVARFDHNPVTGESLGLLVEEQRTNLLLRSEEFDNAAWTKTNATITANQVIAPDGTLVADKVYESTSTSTLKYVFNAGGLSAAASTPYTGTIYAKAGERSRLVAGIWNGVNYQLVQFDLANGIILQEAAAGIATISSVGNGWYRCSVRRTPGAVTTFFSFGPYINATINILTGLFPSYTGDGYSGIYIWGAQLEAGAFPTSYIPTVASQVTRSADAASMTGANFSSWFSNAEGTVYAETIFREVTTAQSAACGIELDLTNRIQIGKRSGGGSATDYKSIVLVNNATQAALTQSNAIVSGTAIKSATSFAVNDFAMSVSANAVQTDNSGILAQFNRLNIGSSHNNLNIMNGTIKKLAFWPKKLENTQLQALTS